MATPDGPNSPARIGKQMECVEPTLEGLNILEQLKVLGVPITKVRGEGPAEHNRRMTMARNRALMEKMGVLTSAQDLRSLLPAKRKVADRAPVRRNLVPAADIKPRRSERNDGKKPSYVEVAPERYQYEPRKLRAKMPRQPRPTEGLWGTCDLMSDLKLEDNFDHKDHIIRWLSRRLPGFTHLICNAIPADRPNDLRDDYNSTSTKAAAWLVKQLPWLMTQRPLLLTVDMSRPEIHLALAPDMASGLLKPNGYERHRRNAFWALLSMNLAKLSVNLASASIMEGLTEAGSQLTRLSSLKIYGDFDLYDIFREGRSCQYVLKLPSLERLFMSGVYAQKLTVQCPRLRTLYIGQCHITGTLSLQPPVQELALRLVTLEGIVMPRGIFEILPSMTGLRTLEICFHTAQLPPLLPASLQEITYFMAFPSCLLCIDFQHLPAACQLPQVQRVCLYHWDTWMPKELSAIQKHTKESKAEVIVRDDCADEGSIIRRETFY